MGIHTFGTAGSTVGKSGMLLFADHKACVPRFWLVELFNGELLRAIRCPKTHYFYDRLVSEKTTQRHFFSTLHPLSTVIFATATVLAFVLLRDSRFNFHCYTQREATPTQKSARKCAATSRDFFRERLQSAFTLANQIR